jgi:hypothetical protein
VVSDEFDPTWNCTLEIPDCAEGDTLQFMVFDKDLLTHLTHPRSMAFSPFLPSLLLVAYAEGDLALFDTTLCVPVVHWGGVAAGSWDGSASVAWSTRRPCVFFVKCGSTLDLWDLAERPAAPVQSVALASPAVPAGFDAPGTCSELSVAPCGRPVVGCSGAALVFGLPSRLTTPLQALPLGRRMLEKPMEEVVKGPENAQLFASLDKHKRTVEVPPACALERDLLTGILAGMQPLQAWV